LSSKPSDAMLDLLKELALLKALDKKSATDPDSEADTAGSNLRENRRREITEKIRALGDPIPG
jgi:hypothetical protein